MIFVVHHLRNASIDLSAARCWGEPRYVNNTADYLYGDNMEGDRLPAEILMRFEDCANEFDPKCDYLLMVGDHAQQVLFAALLATRHPFFRALRYDRQEAAYFPIRIPGRKSLVDRRIAA